MTIPTNVKKSQAAKYFCLSSHRVFCPSIVNLDATEIEVRSERVFLDQPVSGRANQIRTPKITERDSFGSCTDYLLCLGRGARKMRLSQRYRSQFCKAALTSLGTPSRLIASLQPPRTTLQLHNSAKLVLDPLLVRQCSSGIASGRPRRVRSTPRRLLELVDKAFPSVLKTLPPRYKLILASLLDATESLNLATDVLSTFLAIGWRTQVRMGQGAIQAVPSPPSKARVVPVEDACVARDWATWTLHSHASYAPTVSAALAQLDIPHDCLLSANWNATADAPSAAYFLTVDHEHCTIVCTVRGSWSADDALISSMVAPAPFLGGLVHHGMLACARTLVAECGPTIQKAAAQYPHYRVVLTGHSMGGGVAALAGLILRNEALFLKEHSNHGQGPPHVQHAFSSLRFDGGHYYPTSSEVLVGALPGTAPLPAPQKGCKGAQAPRASSVFVEESASEATTGDDSTLSALEHLEVFAVAPGPCMSLDLARACEGWMHSLVHGDDVTPRFNIAAMLVVKQELAGIQWGREVRELWMDHASRMPPPSAAAVRAAGGALQATWELVKGITSPPLRWAGAARRAVMGPSPRDLFWRELSGPVNMHSHALARMQYYLPGCLLHLQYKYENVPCSWDGSADASQFPLQYERGVSIHDPYVALDARAADTATTRHATARHADNSTEDHSKLVHPSAVSSLRATSTHDPPRVSVQDYHPQLGGLLATRLDRVLPSEAFETPCDGVGGVLTPPAVRHYPPLDLDQGAAAHQEYFGRVHWSGRMFLDHSTALTYKHLMSITQGGQQGVPT